MGWIIFFGVALLLSLLFVPLVKWKRLWWAGLIGLIVVYLIDATLIQLSAIRYSYGNPVLSGLPTFYWISAFPAGVLFAYYCPTNKMWQFPYIMLASTFMLSLGFIMYILGYYHLMQWNFIKDFFLNIGAFIIVLWLSQLTGAVG